MPDDISPQEAYELLKNDPGYIYLDVRSVEEFEEGHAPKALNIPIMLRDPASGRMVPNQEFMQVVQANLKPDAKLVVGCKAGGRSATACQILTQLGYANLKNVASGFIGKPGPGGLIPGWSMCGLPVEPGEGGDGQYAKLKGNG
ncbi:MAG: rhodanese-like domain-containing protein [Planctomycetota bacterium]|nr:rhodanese-like domain-containing protein [Planctomycetota bacterium]